MFLLNKMASHYCARLLLEKFQDGMSAEILTVLSEVPRVLPPHFQVYPGPVTSNKPRPLPPPLFTVNKRNQSLL
jgi:hypothetical protein